VDVKQGVFGEGVEVFIEGFIIFFGQFAGFTGPGWFGVVDLVIFVGFHLFAVFPVFLFAKHNGYGHELAVLTQEVIDL